MALSTLFQLALPITRRIQKKKLYDWIIAVSTAVDKIGDALGAYDFAAKAPGAGQTRLIDITAAQLAILNTGARFYVKSFKDQVRWDPASVDAADNITIFAPTVVGVGAGRFYRVGVAAREWQEQVLGWTIDAGNPAANDENDGNVARPLKTFAEWRRRVGDRLLSTQTVNIGPTNLGATDVLDLEGLDVGAFSLQIVGQLTTTVAGQSINAYTARVAATNTPNQLTATAATAWTPLIGSGQFIQMTSGASNGNLATACLDLTGNKARVGTFANLNQVETQPAPGDTFQIVTVPQVTLSRLNAIDAGITISRLRFVTNQVRAICSGLWLATANANIPAVGVIFDHCCFDLGPVFEGSLIWIGCQFMTASGGSTVFTARNQMNVVACCFFDATATKYNTLGGAVMQFSLGTIFQGTGLTIQRGFYAFFNVSFFDTGTTAINAIRSTFATFNTIYGDTGAGNPFALTLDRSSHAALVGATQTLTNGGANEIAMPVTASTTWAAARAAVGTKDAATSDASIMVTT